MTQTTFLWFSGKGGTGKTTLSSATALQLADRGHKVLIISTDPAHSLSDALDVDVTEETRVTDNLTAVELDPTQAVEEYRMSLQEAEFRDQFGVMEDVYESMDIMKQGPGVAEMAAFNTFMRYMQSGEYDVIVFDTAPTGHTLNLLQLPEVMDSMVGKMLKMRMRFSQAVDTVKTLFGQESGQDQDLQKLEALQERIEHARSVMTDPSRTSFNFVMLAEQMSVYETERAVERVQEFGIPVGRIFVNQLIPENPDCTFCSARRAMQQENLGRIQDSFEDHPIVTIPLQEREVRGVDDLTGLTDHMTALSLHDDQEELGE